MFLKNICRGTHEYDSILKYTKRIWKAQVIHETYLTLGCIIFYTGESFVDAQNVLIPPRFHHQAACRPQFLSISHTFSLHNYFGDHRKLGEIQVIRPSFVFLITFLTDRWAHVGAITHLSMGIPWYPCFIGFTQVRWPIALNTDRSTLVPNPSFIPHTSSCSDPPGQMLDMR